MFSTSLETAPRRPFPFGLAFLTLLGMTNVASACAMLFAQG
jgi:hypothetical protein